MPNTAGSSFFSWLGLGKKNRGKKTGRREAITSGRGGRDPSEATKHVRLPDSLVQQPPRVEPPVERPRPFDPPPQGYSPSAIPSTNPPIAPPKVKSASAGETMILRVPDARPQGDVVGVLIGVLGPLKNELYRVYAGSTHLGRVDPDNAEKGGEFHDRDMAISRQHGTLLQLDDGAFHIKPLSSKYSISVNGERLEEDGEMLRDRDSVQMGQTTFLFRVLL